MKHAFDGLISRLNMAEERISELKVCQQKFAVGKSKEKETEKKNKQTISKWDNYKRCNKHTLGIIRRKREKET